MNKTDTSRSNHSSTRFTVGRDQLVSQVAEATATDETGDHLLPIDNSIWLISEDGPRSPWEVMSYLDTGSWPETVLLPTCSTEHCVLHTTTNQVVADEARDEELLQMVQNHTTQRASLAALYQRAKNKGLVAARTDYH